MDVLLKEEVIKLDEELTRLKSAVEYIETAKISIESASKIINTIVALKKEFDVLSGKALALIDKLDKVNFPSRLDTIDNKLLTVNTEIQELKSWVETGNKALVLEIKGLSRNILSEVTDNKNKILSRIDKQSKEINTIRFGTVITIVFIVTLGVLFYLKIL